MNCSTSLEEIAPSSDRRTPLSQCTRPGLAGLASLIFLGACNISGERQPRLIANTQDLPATQLVAGLDAPLAPLQNRFWCASLALAWRALEDDLGFPMEFSEDIEEVVWIRSASANLPDLDPAAIFSAVGQGTDSIAAVRAELQAVGLHWEDADSQLASAVEQSDLALFAYARLDKDLPFANRFRDFEAWALPFSADPSGPAVNVDAFGLSHYGPSNRPEKNMADQVRIHHFDSKEDFVVELIPREGADRIFVARMARKATLRSAWDSVASRLVEEPQKMRAGDSFIAPELDLRLVQSYSRLSGLHLVNAPREGLFLGGVVQDLDLRLDEEGMVVRSRAVIGVASAVIQDVRDMICDGPFLIAAMESDDEAPYFVAWIGHPEVLLEQPSK